MLQQCQQGPQKVDIEKAIICCYLLYCKVDQFNLLSIKMYFAIQKPLLPLVLMIIVFNSTLESPTVIFQCTGNVNLLKNSSHN